MLVFIPAFILFGTAIAVLILQLVPRGTGIAWFTAVFLSVAVWIIVFVLKNNLPLSFTGQLWEHMGTGGNNLVFRVDILTWPFVLTISSLVLGILLVSSSRIGTDTSPVEWAEILIIGGIGFLAVSTANILTVVLVLGLLDLTKLRQSIFSESNAENNKTVNRSFLWRILGLGLFMAASAWQISLNESDTWNSLLPGPAHLVYFACLVRMALFPIFRFQETTDETQNGLYVIRNIIEYLAIFVVITQIPFHPMNVTARALLIGYFLIISVYNSLMIKENQSRSNDIKVWLIAAGTIISAMYILGISSPGIAFGISAVVLAFVLYATYPINRIAKIIGFAAVVGFSGLPFTPNVSGFSAFGSVQIFPGFLFLFPISMLLFVSYKIIIDKKSEDNMFSERWVFILSVIGIFIPTFTIWVIFIINNSQQRIFQISFPALIAAFVSVSLIVNSKFEIIKFDDIKKIKVIDKITKSKKSFVFVQKLPEIVVTMFESLLILIRGLFDGEGGILWSVLSLVLIITIISILGS